jgi:hypothetical protein
MYKYRTLRPKIFDNQYLSYLGGTYLLGAREIYPACMPTASFFVPASFCCSRPTIYIVVVYIHICFNSPLHPSLNRNYSIQTLSFTLRQLLPRKWRLKFSSLTNSSISIILLYYTFSKLWYVLICTTRSPMPHHMYIIPTNIPKIQKKS